MLEDHLVERCRSSSLRMKDSNGEPILIWIQVGGLAQESQVYKFNVGKTDVERN